MGFDNLSLKKYMNIISSLVFALVLLTLSGGFFPIIASGQLSQTSSKNKIAILTFDDGYKSQYTNAKPILDKYGYKTSFFIVCNFIGKTAEQMGSSDIVNFIGKGVEQMSWNDLMNLQKEGNKIEAHSMDHIDLNRLSANKLNYEIGSSKQCLLDHNINTTMFAYPYDKGRNNATVVNTVAKYYTLAKSGNEPLMYLHCNNFKTKLFKTDCDPFSESGKTTFANIYSVIGWSHDYERKIHSYNDSKMYNRFTQVVDSQTDFNKDGIINAIPIIIYHRIDNSREDYIPR